MGQPDQEEGEDGGGGGGRRGGRDLFLPRTLALILYWGLRGIVGLDC